MSKFSQEQKEYQEFVKRIRPKPPYLQNMVMAFLVGGLICAIGQGILNFYVFLGLERTKEAAGATSATLVFLGAFLTGLGVYDEIGKRAGAGSIVPITGFANSIVAPAMEFKSEGYVFGVAAKMFVVAGPVLVYGITSSVIIGFIYYLLKL
ncbi:stage V sporulation protein AC [Thermosediminibacter litoriperuensis]|uniref:Stage V sporulation protein AC n=1 Tax=Thermosediminibacter litoriperuensis TaxID=291989 RepID=A0A5S5ATC9_9FIRM|nr:stage V sporulation protein AC [Thermosediminibacter litoriperuensis]TYP54266.1 stage V sporulation protein AC [Thermosediminibacter litoriperuensis]